MYTPNALPYILFLLSLISLDGASAVDFDTPATKDSTIFRSTVSCPGCPDNNCNKCIHGHDPTLVANTGGLAFIRTLIGFNMPIDGSLVANCTLQIPAFTPPLQSAVTVTISKADVSSWNEDTVNGENAPLELGQVSSVTVPAGTNMGPLDITQACRSANGHLLDIYIGTQFGRIEFPSKDSGNPAILHITRFT
ncbi:hypothetical protein GGI12_001962 [Dipsacomyces acuminosporus]|nr:hypothetical protein GGI12_001962 [Dipsacomyces acuminosporus]